MRQAWGMVIKRGSGPVKYSDVMTYYESGTASADSQTF